VRASGPVTFGDVTYQAGGEYGPRMQADFQLVAVYVGEAHVHVDDDVRHIPAQHVALLHPGHLERFLFSPHGPTHHTWCAVHPTLVERPLAEALTGVPLCVPITTRMHGLIEMGLSFALSDLAQAHGVLVQLGLAALHDFAFEAERAILRSHTPDAVARAQQYIETHLSHPIRLGDVSRAASVTPQHLVKLFRRHLRTTPMRYVWDARVRRGAELLTQSGLSVSEVAAQCGFQTPFHFSRLIKQRYGLPPRELRKREWRS
jgi:AraC family transcriptional regulator of arabinose operon